MNQGIKKFIFKLITSYTLKSIYKFINLLRFVEHIDVSFTIRLYMK